MSLKDLLTQEEIDLIKSRRKQEATPVPTPIITENKGLKVIGRGNPQVIQNKEEEKEMTNKLNKKLDMLEIDDLLLLKETNIAKKELQKDAKKEFEKIREKVSRKLEQDRVNFLAQEDQAKLEQEYLDKKEIVKRKLNRTVKPTPKPIVKKETIEDEFYDPNPESFLPTKSLAEINVRYEEAIERLEFHQAQIEKYKAIVKELSKKGKELFRRKV